MAQIKISGEKIFQIVAHSFIISPSSEGYTLQYSADGENFTDWDENTPAGENLVVTNVPRLAFYKLKGNGSEIIINY